MDKVQYKSQTFPRVSDDADAPLFTLILCTLPGVAEVGLTARVGKDCFAFSPGSSTGFQAQGFG